jgi:hypothetical protein
MGFVAYEMQETKTERNRRHMKITPSVQSTSSMNHFFLKTITGEIDYEVINNELTHYIDAIAERYYTMNRETKTEIIKGIKQGNYFKDVPSDEIEDSLNKAIERLTGKKYPGVAHYYTFLIESAKD